MRGSIWRPLHGVRRVLWQWRRHRGSPTGSLPQNLQKLSLETKQGREQSGCHSRIEQTVRGIPYIVYSILKITCYLHIVVINKDFKNTFSGHLQTTRSIRLRLVTVFWAGPFSLVRKKQRTLSKNHAVSHPHTKNKETNRKQTNKQTKKNKEKRNNDNNNKMNDPPPPKNVGLILRLSGTILSALVLFHC